MASKSCREPIPQDSIHFTFSMFADAVVFSCAFQFRTGDRLEHRFANVEALASKPKRGDVVWEFGPVVSLGSMRNTARIQFITSLVHSSLVKCVFDCVIRLCQDRPARNQSPSACVSERANSF